MVESVDVEGKEEEREKKKSKASQENKTL